jgi:hypothetical protein
MTRGREIRETSARPSFARSPSQPDEFVSPLEQGPGGRPGIHRERARPEAVALEPLENRLECGNPHNLSYWRAAETCRSLKDVEQARWADDRLPECPAIAAAMIRSRSAVDPEPENYVH